MRQTVLLTADQIRHRVAEMASEIQRDFPGDLHLVAVLKGAFVFLADLMRDLTGPVSVDFLAVSSYPAGTTTSGEIRVLKDLDTAIEGRHVVLVEDIVDTGLTLAYLQGMLAARAPATLKTAALLNKPSRRRTDVSIDYVGFTIEDQFVVGYGLDLAERHRNLPHIAAVPADTV